MDTNQLQLFLRSYPNGVAAVVYQHGQQLESWYASGKADAEFVPLTVQNLPRAYDYRELLLHFARQPLILGDEQFFMESYKEDTIVLTNEMNQKLHRVAISLWPERKTLVAVGCRNDQVGYNEALAVLKNDQIIKIVQQKQRQVHIQFDNQTHSLDVVKNSGPLRRKSQTQVFVWFPNLDAAHPVLPQLYAASKQFKDMWFCFCFGQLSKAQLDPAEHYYLNLINIAECMNQDFAERAGPTTQYFITTADQQQRQAELTDVPTLVSELQGLVNAGPFSVHQFDDKVNPVNAEHNEYLGFYGRSLKYVQNVKNADAQAYVVADFSSDDEKAPEYAKQLLQLQKKYSRVQIIISLRGQLSISKEILANIHQKDRSFKELCLCEGFSEALQKHLETIAASGDGQKMRPSYITYVDINKQVTVLDPEAQKQDIQKVMDSMLSQFSKELEKTLEETQEEPEPDYDMTNDPETAEIVDDTLHFRGFRFQQLAFPQPFLEGKAFCVVYISQQTGFEKAVEMVYKTKELLNDHCQFFVTVKGLKQKSQLAEMSKRAYFLSRLNILQYKSGFGRFMQRVEQIPHSAVFFDAGGQHLPIEGDRAINPIVLADEQMLLSVAQSVGSNSQLLAAKKQPQLLQINKPQRGQFVHGGAVFNVQGGEYTKQRYVCFVFLTEDNRLSWQPITEKLCEMQANKVCAQLMFPVVVAQSVEVLETNASLRKINYCVDAIQSTYNQQQGLCAVWDTHTFTMAFAESMQQVEEEYLRKKMEEALRNTNVFTDDLAVKIHQFEFKYLVKAAPKRNHQIACFITLQDDSNLLKNIAQIKNLEMNLNDLVYFVVSVPCNKKRFAEVQVKMAYDMTVVEHNPTSDVQMTSFGFIISDNGGIQMVMGSGLVELTQELLAKTRITSIPPLQLADCSNSQSVIIDGVQLPLLNRFLKKNDKKTAVCFCNELNKQVSACIIQALERSIYVMLMCAQASVNMEDFLNVQDMYQMNILAFDKLVFDAYCTGQPVFVIDEGKGDAQKVDTATFQSYIEKLPKASVDVKLLDEDEIELQIKDKKFKIKMEQKSRRRRTCMTAMVTLFDSQIAKTDDLFTIYKKQTRNGSLYMVAAFPSDRLLRESGMEPLPLNQIITKYKLMNIARYDSKDALAFAGQSLMFTKQRWVQVDLGNVDAKRFCDIVPIRCVQIHDDHIDRLCIKMPFMHKTFKDAKEKILVAPVTNENIASLLTAAAKYTDWTIIGVADIEIENKQLSIVSGIKKDHQLASDGYNFIKSTQAKLDQVIFPPKLKTSKVFDYKNDETSKISKTDLSLQGYQFKILKGFPPKENQQVFVAVLLDLQDMIRFHELVSGDQYGLGVIPNVHDQATLQECIINYPIVSQINLAVWNDNMQVMKHRKLFIFNEELQFETQTDLYFQNPLSHYEPTKLTFNLKFGANIASPNEENFNPNHPMLVNGKIKFAVRSKRFRSHRNKYAAQKTIIWIQGAKYAQFMSRFNKLVEKGIYVIGGIQEAPVFDDEIRYLDEEIDRRISQEVDTLTDDDQKKIKEAEILGRKINVANVNLVDFDCGAKEELLVMHSDQPGSIRPTTLEELEALYK